MILKNHTSVPIRKKRLGSTSKARREESQNGFMEKSGMPERELKALEKYCSKNCPKPLLGFVTPFEID